MNERNKTADRVAAPRSVAIACQGGGSHTAFTAGVLQAVLPQLDERRYVVRGLSGTSGGALCAALAWYGLLLGDREKCAALLESFWREMSATLPWDALSNQGLVWLERWRNLLALPEISPYQLPATGQDYLAAVLERHIPFARLDALIGPDSPVFLAGAVEVLSGKFTVFHSRHRNPAKRISAAALLASAAIPELFRAVHLGGGVYWDGLFSENPPIRGFLAGSQSAAAKPDEIWVIQINPERRTGEPKSLSDIADRRNELAGNLSLNQELFFVRQTNDWLAKGWLNAAHFKPVDIRFIALERELDYASKLDRSPGFIADLMAEGRRQGAAFLQRLP